MKPLFTVSLARQGDRWAGVLILDLKHLLISTAAGIGIMDLTGRVTETLLKLGKNSEIYPHFSAT
ncbi:hypothetical protein [Nonomuraea sp. NPDC003201]